MEILIDKAREYIIALQAAGKFTYDDMEKMSGVAAQTIRNFLTKRTDKNPGFATIVRLVMSLGGDLNELVGYEKKKEIELNSTISLKESYEIRMEEILKSCEVRIEEIKESCETRIADILKCCETRIADMKQFYEERHADYKELMNKVLIINE